MGEIFTSLGEGITDIMSNGNCISEIFIKK